MIVLHVVEALSFPVLLFMAAAALKRPTFPASDGTQPRPGIPDCKQTSEVKP